jgi:hypothetical protein
MSPREYSRAITPKNEAIRAKKIAKGSAYRIRPKPRSDIQSVLTVRVPVAQTVEATKRRRQNVMAAIVNEKRALIR